VNAAQWRDVDLSRFGNVVIRPRGGQQPDAGEARSDYFHSLAHSAAVVGINTSALIESAILGKSVYTVLAPEFRGTQTGTLHFHYLLYENGGFLHVAESLDDHVRQLDRVLTHGKADEEQTLRFVASFIRPNGMDRPATPILADGIEELARLAPPQPVGTPVWAWGLRGLLSLVALFAGLLFALDRLVRRVLYHPTAKTTGRWLLRRRAAAPLARRLEARRASARPRPDLPPKPPQELRLAAVEPSPQVVAVEAELERIAARGAPVVPGPWTGSAEHELLYWRPFLTWARERYGLDLVEPSDAASANGSAVHLPPTLALDLVRGFRTGGAPLGEVLERLRFERLTPPADPELEATLPDEFVAVSLARGPARDRVRDALASRGEIVSANLDGEEPRDAAAQATVVARARVLVAELGPVALLGPFLGVPTIALATPDAAASPDLDVAYRAARALGTAFVVLDSAHVEIAGAVAAAAAA
jgi:hypothetical protein